MFIIERRVVDVGSIVDSGEIFSYSKINIMNIE
jgi:hypothetical protein